MFLDKSPGRYRSVAAASILLALAAPTAAVRSDDLPRETPWELRPYRVQIDVSFGTDIDREWRERLLRRLAEGLERGAGGLWEVDIRADVVSRLAGIDSLSRLKPSDLADASRAGELDKWYFASVETAGAGLQIAGREWDGATRQLGAVQSRTLPDRAEAPLQLVELLRSLFRPLASIEQSRGSPPRLKARGGALTPHDEAWQAIREGMLFEPYYRYLNKDLAVERIQQVPWTYVTAGPSAEGITEATVISGLRSPLGVRRRRVEAVALGVGRRIDSTRLTLVTRGPGQRPQGGIQVELSADPQAAEAPPEQAASESGSRVFVTDRKGQVRLSADPASEPAPIWLFVRSGQNLLARVPFVPGIRADERLELPDDTVRLEFEGRVAQLQSELIDAVARRAVLIAMVRQGAKARDWSRVEEYEKSLAAGPSSTSFSAELTTIRVQGLQAARAQRDRPTELRIQRLCDDLNRLIGDYLEDNKLGELREEIVELKKIAAEDAAADEALKEGRPAGRTGVSPPRQTPEKKSASPDAQEPPPF